MMMTSDDWRDTLIMYCNSRKGLDTGDQENVLILGKMTQY